MAATFTTSCTFTELDPNSGYKEITVATPTGASGDIVNVTLEDHGISKLGFLAINGYVQTTSANVVVTEAPTTTVSAGVLAITSSTGVGIKVYRILGKSN